MSQDFQEARMPKPLDAMLSRWPLLHPEITGASEKDDARTGDAARVREESSVRSWRPRTSTAPSRRGRGLQEVKAVIQAE